MVGDLPGDCEIDSAIEMLIPIRPRKQRFVCVGPNATVVVRELVTVLDEVAVELDYIRILAKRIRSEQVVTGFLRNSGATYIVTELIRSTIDADNKIATFVGTVAVSSFGRFRH